MVPVNLTNVPVLVLNQNFEPLNICRVRRAVVLVLDGKAEVIENGRGELHAITTSVPIPSVVRLTQFVKRPAPAEAPHALRGVQSRQIHLSILRT